MAFPCLVSSVNLPWFLSNLLRTFCPTHTRPLSRIQLHVVSSHILSSTICLLSIFEWCTVQGRCQGLTYYSHAQCSLFSPRFIMLVLSEWETGPPLPPYNTLFYPWTKVFCICFGIRTYWFLHSWVPTTPNYYHSFNQQCLLIFPYCYNPMARRWGKWWQQYNLTIVIVSDRFLASLSIILWALTVQAAPSDGSFPFFYFLFIGILHISSLLLFLTLK